MFFIVISEFDEGYLAVNVDAPRCRQLTEHNAFYIELNVKLESI